jgi:hypothetical protein
MSELIMPRTIHMNAKRGSFKVTGQDAELRRTVIVRAVKRNWPLLIDYSIATLGGVAVSYLTSGWLSVALSIFIAMATFPIGFHMLTQVITITNEIR